MPQTLPNASQPHMDYYEHYRRGVIQRHIAKNGRFLQWVMLVEQDQSKLPPDAAFHAIRRHSTERLLGGETEYEYSAYPVVIHDPELDDTRWYAEGDYVVGGGDNPLLQGGLAMATFSLEELLDVSPHSFDYACRLLDFFLDSETTQANGEPGGFPLRRAHWWSDPKEASKDELCGILLGIHFFLKAAAKRGDSHQLGRASRYLRRMGRYLKDRQYGPAGAYIFQFPFTRVFKFGVGTPYLSGTTTPDDRWWSFFPVDQFVSLLTNLYSVFQGDFDFHYRPRDLYRDLIDFQPEFYQGAIEIGVAPKFFNVAMIMHTLLMIHDNPVMREVREDLWGPVKRLFDYFCMPDQRIPSLRGDGYNNAYFGVVMRAFAESLGRLSDLGRSTMDMYSIVARPGGIFQHDLPLTHLGPKYYNLPGNEPFVSRMDDGLRIGGVDMSGSPRWGGYFEWEHPDSGGHSFWLSWWKTLDFVGPTDTDANRDLLATVSDGTTRGLVQGKYYHASPDLGFRLEAAGLDLLFPWILAAYYGFAQRPELQNNVSFEVLPVDGARVKGYIGNVRHREVHAYFNQRRQCQISEILERKFFRELKEAHSEGYDNCAHCIGGSKR